MTHNFSYYVTVMVAMFTMMSRIATAFNDLDMGIIRQTGTVPYDGSGGYAAPRIYYLRKVARDSSRGFGAPPSFETNMGHPRSGIFSSTSSSIHGSSSGTAGPAAAFGTSAAGGAQSSSLQDGTAGATSGLAATHNVYGANRATGSSAEGGTSSSTGGHGAASGFGHANYRKGQFGIGNTGAQEGYAGHTSVVKAGRYISSNRPEAYTGGYALEKSGVTGLVDYLGHADDYGYIGTHSLGSNIMSKGYDSRNTFGRHVGGSGTTNLIGGHSYGGTNVLEGSIGNYKQVSANTIGKQYENNEGKLSAGYIGGFTSDGASVKGHYVDMYGEGGTGSLYESGAIHGGRGAYAGSGYEGVGLFSNIKQSLGAHEMGATAGNAYHAKQGYAGTGKYLGAGFEEQWANIYAPAIMSGDSSEDYGTHIGEHVFDNIHAAHSRKDIGISGGAGGYGSLIGSSSSSESGGSSSATSGYGAALAASAEGRVQSSSLHDGASEATSGLAAALGIHGKNKAIGSSSEKGTSTGTGGMAAANALGGIKTRTGTFGSSSSSNYGGASSGTSGFGVGLGVSGFGRAQSSSLHDGTSGATSGLAATQSLYGKNRASGSSGTGGTSSSTGGFGAASGLGYNIGGNKIRNFIPIEMPQNTFYGDARHLENPYGEHPTLMRHYPAGEYGSPYGPN